jgi:divinyl protochlorophyllide a 8-vinyl-reductase
MNEIIGRALLDAAHPDSVGTPSAGRDGHVAVGHRVGPNAIIQTRAALIDACGAEPARRVFLEAGIGAWFDTPPQDMVPARKVHGLNMALLAGLDGEAFEAVMRDAGRRTGWYILENRIPGAAKALLKVLPARLGAGALLKAIRANAWTFAGSAPVSVQPGRPAIIEITGNPLPMPGCPWHAAVFETLFTVLLGRPVDVSHQFGGRGGRVDRFEVRWGTGKPPRHFMKLKK